MHAGRLLCRGGEAGDGGDLEVGQCQFDRENGTMVARREDPDRTVSGLTSCNITKSVNISLSHF